MGTCEFRHETIATLVVRMPANSYAQYCGLARALDVAGDRWALLVVRELVPGPRRFTDLIESLPGISRKVLTERLRGLERDGVVARRDLPPPAARQVYELTDDGRDLAGARVPLIGWGARRLGRRRPDDSFQPRWAAIAMASFADRSALAGVSETYQYLVGDSAFHFRAEDGSIEVRDGVAPDPAVVVTTDEETWAAIATGETTASSAADAGALSYAGGPRAVERVQRIFSREQLIAQADAAVGGGRRD
jgi:DNA-binding HxlR family transcriptional regulator/putative sterol carrier protein